MATILGVEMSDIGLSEDQISACTDRDLLEQHKAQLVHSGTEPGWIESYWVHRVSFHGNRYRQRYCRQVYRDDSGQLIRKHIPVRELSSYRQKVANRRKLERIERRLRQLDSRSPQKTPI